MTTRRTLTLAAVALTLATTRPLDAFPGDRCAHTRDCSPRELCIADGDYADLGRCVRAKVLP